MARFRLIFLLAFLVAGCELVFGIKESTTSGTGGGAAGTTSSGTGGGASGTTTSSSTSSTSSTSSGSDAGFCASRDAGYYFCADFDEGGILGPDGSSTLQWDSLDQTAGGPIDAGLDDATVVSAPASLEVISPPMPGSSCQSSRVVKELEGPWHEFTSTSTSILAT